MIARSRVAASILAAVAAGGVVPAQAPAPPKPSRFEERVEVRLVQVPILALDRKGRPVRDLRADEIEIRDRGEKRTVAYLEPLRSPPAAPPDDAKRVRLFIDAPGGQGVPIEAAGSTPHRLVILVDVENDDPLGRNQGLDDLLAFARTALDAGTVAAVASFDGTLHLEASFTRDRNTIEAALAQAWSRHGAPRMSLSSRISRLVSRLDDCKVTKGEFSAPVADRRCLGDAVSQYVEEVRPAANRFLDALSGLVQILAGVDGGKTVIALSHGIAVDPSPEVLEAARAVYGPGDEIGFVQQAIGFGDLPRVRMDEILGLAMRHRVSLFFVDRTRAPAAAGGARLAHALQPGTHPIESAYAASQDVLREAAATTGGVFVAAPDRLRSGLAEALGAEEAAYEVGYRVDEAPTPERLARVTISSTRKGVRITHRRGYYAASEAEATVLKGSIEIGSVDSAGSPGAGPARRLFRVVVDPRSIGYEVSGDSASSNFTLNVVVRSASGRPLAESFHFVNHSYPRGLWETGKVAPITLPGWLEAPAGDYEIAATIRNVSTGRGGTIVNAVAFE